MRGIPIAEIKAFNVIFFPLSIEFKILKTDFSPKSGFLIHSLSCL